MALSDKDRANTAVGVSVVLAVILFFVGNSLYDKSKDLRVVCQLRPDPAVVAIDPKTPEEAADAICEDALGSGGTYDTDP